MVNFSSRYSHYLAHNTEALPEFMDKPFDKKDSKLREYLTNLEHEMKEDERKQSSRVDVFERKYAVKCPDWRSRYCHLSE